MERESSSNDASTISKTLTSDQINIKDDIYQKKKQNSFVLTTFVAGALAGASAKTFIAPLDRTKINFQGNSNYTSTLKTSLVSQRRKYSFRAALKFVKLTYQTSGFWALYRGNSATLARVIPYAAIQFSVHEQYKQIFKIDKDGNKTPGRRYLAGSLAAVTATCFTYPLDTAKARLSVSEKKKYKNLSHVFVKEYRKHGITIFYRGIYPTLLGVIPYAGSSFYTYETCKIIYTEKTGVEEMNAVLKLLSGAFAGLVGQSTSYPFDIVRRRMQVGRIPQNRGIFYSLYRIWLHEGFVNGLYKGLSMNWLKGPVAVGISFSVYDSSKRYLEKLYFSFFNSL